MITIGIDEVGRGAWAGPVCVAAVAGDAAVNDITGLGDSKKLSKNQRQGLELRIRQQAIGIGIGWASSVEIDEQGLQKALRIAAERAVLQLPDDLHESKIITDGNQPLLGWDNEICVPKADATEPTVSAASIIAKQARDRMMQSLDLLFEYKYQFTSSVGYGTAKHADGLKEHGVSSHHRKSFAPVAAVLSS